MTSLHAATRLVLLRHGQSLFNRDGEAAGSDSGLTELGWRQAQAAAQWLAAHVNVDAITASTLTRARQTAEVIGQRLGLPVELVAGLEEADFAYWAELPLKQEGPLAAWRAAWQPSAAGSPQYEAFRTRLSAALEQILSAYAGKTVLAVSHGGAIGTILRSMFGGHHVAVNTENTGITQLIWTEGYWRLDCHNRVEHLAGLAGRPRPTSVEREPATEAASGATASQIAAVVDHYQRVAQQVTIDTLRAAVDGHSELVEFAAPQPAERVLDAATGAGAVALALAAHAGQVLGVDLSPALLERAEVGRAALDAHNVRFRLGDITQIRPAEAPFDLITCRDLLKYAANLEAVFDHFGHLLTETGRLVIDEVVGAANSVKRATQEAIELRRDPALTAIRSQPEIETALKAAGFRVRKAFTYTVTRELSEWLAETGATEAVRGAVKAMLEAGLESDSAGLGLRRGREGQLILTHTRLRLMASQAAQRH